jgi:hypothetical protein
MIENDATPKKKASMKHPPEDLLLKTCSALARIMELRQQRSSTSLYLLYSISKIVHPPLGSKSKFRTAARAPKLVRLASPAHQNHIMNFVSYGDD